MSFVSYSIISVTYQPRLESTNSILSKKDTAIKLFEGWEVPFITDQY